MFIPLPGMREVSWEPIVPIHPRDSFHMTVVWGETTLKWAKHLHPRVTLPKGSMKANAWPVSAEGGHSMPSEPTAPLPQSLLASEFREARALVHSHLELTSEADMQKAEWQHLSIWAFSLSWDNSTLGCIFRSVARDFQSSHWVITSDGRVMSASP